MLLCTKEKLKEPLGFVYVLSCKGGRFYVGFSRQLAKRIKQHFKGAGAQFTQTFKPLRVLLAKPANGEHDEFALWKSFAKKYGYRRVGGWNRFLCAEFGFKWPF